MDRVHVALLTLKDKNLRLNYVEKFKKILEMFFQNFSERLKKFFHGKIELSHEILREKERNEKFSKIKLEFDYKQRLLTEIVQHISCSEIIDYYKNKVIRKFILDNFRQTLLDVSMMKHLINK